MGLARTGGEWRSAAEWPGDSTPWQIDSALSESTAAVPVVEQLEAMKMQSTPQGPSDGSNATYDASRQEASDGSVLWTLLLPRADDEVETQQWIVNPEGILQFYRLFLDMPPLGEDVGTIVVEYGVEDVDPEPVIIPDLGTKLRLNRLGIPDALQNLEE